MARKLLRFTTLLAVPALVLRRCGCGWATASAAARAGWMHAKLAWCCW
jgi:uncharacterized membrane protein